MGKKRSAQPNTAPKSGLDLHAVVDFLSRHKSKAYLILSFILGALLNFGFYNASVYANHNFAGPYPGLHLTDINVEILNLGKSEMPFTFVPNQSTPFILAIHNHWIEDKSVSVEIDVKSPITVNYEEATITSIPHKKIDKESLETFNLNLTINAAPKGYYDLCFIVTDNENSNNFQKDCITIIVTDAYR